MIGLIVVWLLVVALVTSGVALLILGMVRGAAHPDFTIGMALYLGGPLACCGCWGLAAVVLEVSSNLLR